MASKELNRESIIITRFSKKVYKHARVEKTMTENFPTRLVQSKAQLESTHYTFQKEDDKCLTKVSGITFWTLCLDLTTWKYD